ncbi:hypothetical protein VNO78_09630 [Psophocarpus tetragonolobus]|uniref:Uncharacterized protein n=1 Tax=Psophocarpus tetragonolobus TaxID=3891 RepID=A0AAN9XU69_PSOTE
MPFATLTISNSRNDDFLPSLRLSTMRHFLFSLGNYLDVISRYNDVLYINPLAVDGLVNRGNTYEEIGRGNICIDITLKQFLNLMYALSDIYLTNANNSFEHEKKMLELIRRKLKKNSVALDIVNFGEEDEGKTEAENTPHNC